MNPKDKNADGVTREELLAEDPAQTRPPAQILLEDTAMIDSVAPEKTAERGAPEKATPQAKKRPNPDGVSQSELLEEDPAQTRPPAQILLEDTPEVKK